MAKNCINSNCGKEIPSSATFCPFCGAQQVEDVQLSEEEKLRKEMNEMQETMTLLKKALADAQQNSDSPAESVPAISNRQKQSGEKQEVADVPKFKAQKPQAAPQSQNNDSPQKVKVFEGMEQVLKAQFKRMITGREDIYCSINNGLNGQFIISTSSTHAFANMTNNYNYKSNGIVIYYTFGQNERQNKKFMEKDFFPLFTFADLNTDGSQHYWVNFGQDYENAAKLLFRIIVEVLSVNLNTPLEYVIWSYKNRDVKLNYNTDEYYIYERYRGGKNESLHKTFENQVSIDDIEKQELKKAKKSNYGAAVTIGVILIVLVLLIKILLPLILTSFAA
jgi:hypothetical protein